MTTITQARAPVRALVSAAAFGSLVGLAMGVAYLGGAVAKSTNVEGRAERLANAAESDFSNDALIEASGADASALAIARRHDPYSVAGGAQRDRQAALLAARLEDQQDSLRAGLRPAALTLAAAPFRLSGALDDSRALDCMTQAVYYEARGEGVAGMQAVAQVVLNRVRHAAFPKTVCGVVFQGAGQRTGCQFSFACDGSLRASRHGDAWRRAQEVAAKALSGHVMAQVGTATHFHTTAVSPGWRSSLMRVSQVGRHVFYRFSGRAGGLRAYSGRPSTEMETARPVIAGFAPAALTADENGAPVAYKILFKGVPEPTAAEPAAARAAAAKTLVSEAAAETPKPEADTPVEASLVAGQ